MKFLQMGSRSLVKTLCYLRVRAVITLPCRKIGLKTCFTDGLGYDPHHRFFVLRRSMGFFSRGKSKVDIKEEKSIMAKAQVLTTIEKKTKTNFIDFIESFKIDNPNRRGHVEFIYACLKNLDEFGLNKDIETYIKILDVFPKGKMIASNALQADFMYFPRQQQCAIDVLQKMEDNGVIPNIEMKDLLLITFGLRSFVYKKFARMMYWMPKFKNASPWPLPNPLPNDTFQLALLAISRINTADLQSVVSVYQASEMEDAIDPTWIVSAQSPTQEKLVSKLPHDKPIYVEGAYRVWLRATSIAYFVLRAERDHRVYPKEDLDDVTEFNTLLNEDSDEQRQKVIVRPSVHEQEDGTILATCATGTSSQDSLLSWVRFLQTKNPHLKDVPVLFTLRSPSSAVVPVNTSGLVQENQEESSSKQEVEPHTT